MSNNDSIVGWGETGVEEGAGGWMQKQIVQVSYCVQKEKCVYFDQAVRELQQ